MLLLYGGSFDPPHCAHIELPLRIRREIGAEAVAYIPAAMSPLKTDRRPTPAHHRLAMLERALAGRDDAVVYTLEIDHDITRAAEDGGHTARQGGNAIAPSYTIDTVRTLRQRLPAEVTLRLLIGADQMLLFHKWKDAPELEALAEPLVMLRPPWTEEKLWAEAPPELDPEKWKPRLTPTPMLDVSSSEVRKRLTRGEPIDHLVPASVAEYIQRYGLYSDTDATEAADKGKPAANAQQNNRGESSGPGNR